MKLVYIFVVVAFPILLFGQSQTRDKYSIHPVQEYPFDEFNQGPNEPTSDFEPPQFDAEFLGAIQRCESFCTTNKDSDETIEDCMARVCPAISGYQNRN